MDSNSIRYYFYSNKDYLLVQLSNSVGIYAVQHGSSVIRFPLNIFSIFVINHYVIFFTVERTKKHIPTKIYFV